MLVDVIAVEPLDGYRLRLTFKDGAEGEVAVDEMIEFDGVFAPLQDLEYFRKVSVNSDIGTICWPNDADIDPDVLYSVVTGEPIRIAQHLSTS